MVGMGNDLIREARRRRGLTQAQLAALAGTTQSAVARLESGRTAPSFDDVVRYLRLMRLDLDVMLVELDDSDWVQAQRMLALTPAQRQDAFENLLDQARAMQEARVMGASDA
ncbi:hypothetical protein GCM10028798_13440 [Humibacter antri]